jgi:hypothetical protein
VETATSLAWLFPARKRDFPGKRWVKIGLRSLHLVGLAGVGGAYLYAAAVEAWFPYLLLTLATGLAMMLLEIWGHGLWLLQMRGLAIVFKLLLLALSMVAPAALDPPLVITVILISGIIAHAPGRLRYYSPFYRRMITLDDWQWRNVGDRG